MRRGSSLRRMRLPTSVSVLVMVVAMAYASRLRRGGLHRVDDVLIAGAAAEIAFEAVADFVVGGAGVRSSSCFDVMIMPGVQNPHCRPCSFQKASCTGCSLPSCARPSMVTTLRRRPGRRTCVQDLTALPSSSTVQAPQMRSFAADVGPGQPDDLAQVVNQQQARLDLVSPLLAIDRHRDQTLHGTSRGNCDSLDE